MGVELGDLGGYDPYDSEISVDKDRQGWSFGSDGAGTRPWSSSSEELGSEYEEGD